MGAELASFQGRKDTSEAGCEKHSAKGYSSKLCRAPRSLCIYSSEMQSFMWFDLYFIRVTLASVSRVVCRNAGVEAGRAVGCLLQKSIEG